MIRYDMRLNLAQAEATESVLSAAYKISDSESRWIDMIGKSRWNVDTVVVHATNE